MCTCNLNGREVKSSRWIRCITASLLDEFQGWRDLASNCAFGGSLASPYMNAWTGTELCIHTNINMYTHPKTNGYRVTLQVCAEEHAQKKKCLFIYSCPNSLGLEILEALNLGKWAQFTNWHLHCGKPVFMGKKKKTMVLGQTEDCIRSDGGACFEIGRGVQRLAMRCRDPGAIWEWAHCTKCRNWLPRNSKSSRLLNTESDKNWWTYVNIIINEAKIVN